MTASPPPMPTTPLEEAFLLTPEGQTLHAIVGPQYSNAPPMLPPEKGFPFGGLLAALCAKAMRQGLELDVPMRTLSVQYLAAAKYGQSIGFNPCLLRGGRRITYAAVEAFQGDVMTHHATATFGADSESSALQDAFKVPPALDTMPDGPGMEGPVAPRFAAPVEYRFETGPHIFGGNKDKARTERAWLRMRDASPLDELRLCYLLDSIYPPSWTAFEKPPIMTTVDLRYDFIASPTAENTPDGWAFFEFALLDHGLGWAVDDVKAWGADGTLLATSRQRRKVLSSK